MDQEQQQPQQDRLPPRETLEHYREWIEGCKKRREWVLTHPLQHPRMIVLPQYLFKQKSFHLPYVEWHVRFGLHTWARPPFWEASITMITDYPDTENKFGLPDEGTPFFINWTHDQKKEARNMLNDVFGPIIRHADDTQRLYVTEGSTHLLIKCLYEKDKLV